MKHDLKLLHWNICQEYRSINTPLCIVSEILKHDPDIVVLTEFLQTPNHKVAIVNPLEKNGFHVILSPYPLEPVFPRHQKSSIRQILVAVKEDKISIDNAEFFQENANEIKEKAFYNTKYPHYPNYIKVNCKTNGGNLTIIGTRIRVWKGSGSDERKFRKSQLSKLLNEIDDKTNTIILGDFNISEWYNGADWNFKTDYRTAFEHKGFSVHIPRDGNSPVGSDKAQDHLITSQSISLRRTKNGIPIISYLESFSGREWIGLKNYPDHAILLACIEL